MNCVGCESVNNISICFKLPVCPSCAEKLKSESVKIVVERWIKETNNNFSSALIASKILKPIGRTHSLDEVLQKGLDAKILYIQKKIEQLSENKKILQEHPSVRLKYLFERK